DLDARNTGQVECDAGAPHGLRHRVRFFLVHPTEKSRHQKGAHLIVRHLPAGKSDDECRYLIGIEGLSFAFSDYQVDNVEILHMSCEGTRRRPGDSTHKRSADTKSRRRLTSVRTPKKKAACSAGRLEAPASDAPPCPRPIPLWRS